MSVQNVTSLQPRFTHLLSDVLHIFVDEDFYVNDLTKTSKKLLLKPNPKDGERMEDLGQKLLSFSDLVLDLFVVMYYTAKVRHLLGKHRRLWDVKSAFVAWKRRWIGL